MNSAPTLTRQTGTMEFAWLSTESPPPLLAVLEAKHRADETFEASWADQPVMRYKVLAVTRDFASDSGLLTAKVDLVAEAM